MSQDKRDKEIVQEVCPICSSDKIEYNDFFGVQCLNCGQLIVPKKVNNGDLPNDCQSKEDGICRLPIGTCIQCASKRVQNKDAKFHVVEFAGYFVVKTEPYYDAGEDILNAEDVGYDKAQENAELIVNLLNKHYETK